MAYFGASRKMATAERSCKRARTAAAPAPAPAAPQHVLFRCIDEVNKLVEVDRSLLDHFDLRLASVVRHSAPVEEGGCSFYRSGMTHAMLLTLVRSLTLGELVLFEGVSIAEALATFEHEGAVVGRPNAPPAIAQPRNGVAFSKRTESTQTRLITLCEQVADALCHWPRLEQVMDNAFDNQMGLISVAELLSYTATANRAWVRFAHRPRSIAASYLGHPDTNSARWQRDADFAHSIICQSPYPRWFVECLIAMGVMHHRLALVLEDGQTFAQSRSKESFKRLCDRLDADALGTFFAVRVDSHQQIANGKLRKELASGERYAKEIKQSIMYWHNTEDRAKMPLGVQYAIAVVVYLDHRMRSTPVCARIFSAHCADKSGNTVERRALKKALKTRKITVLRWEEERDPNVHPLVFPPQWREPDKTGCYGPSVLLSFDGLK